MKRGYWILIIILVLIALYYFFNPFCEFHRIGSGYKPKGDCNTCSCGLFGQGLCTMMNCVLSEEQMLELFDCIKYFDGCNTCTLQDDGWVCTEKACIFNKEPECLEYKEQTQQKQN